MASIKSGTYTFGEILDAAGFDFNEKAAADYLNGGPDFRRVQVGGLGFDSLEDRIFVPPTADEVVVTLDGEPDTTLDVELDDEALEERRYSFSVAADADDSRNV